MNYGTPYGNYFQYPYGYQNQMQRQGQMANMQMQQMQPQMQPMEQPVMNSVPFREVKFVTSDEAKSYVLFPNTSVLLIDRQNGVAYVKSADNLGQSFTETFHYTKADNASQGQNYSPQGANDFGGIDMSAYITNEQLEHKKYATQDDLDKLSLKIEEMNKKLSTRLAPPKEK